MKEGGIFYNICQKAELIAISAGLLVASAGLEVKSKGLMVKSAGISVKPAGLLAYWHKNRPILWGMCETL
jgi:hypothetical protein